MPRQVQYSASQDRCCLKNLSRFPDFCACPNGAATVKRGLPLSFCQGCKGIPLSFPVHVMNPAAVSLIVSKEPLVRLGMRHFLMESAGISVCLEACGSMDAMRQLMEHKPALVIVFACDRPLEVVRLVRELRRKRRSQPVLVVSRTAEEDHVRRCLDAGVLGYTTTGDDLNELRLACAAVMRGDMHLSKSAARVIQGANGHSKNWHGGMPASGTKALTVREVEVFRLMGSGLGCKELAAQLGISVKTVETHQMRLKEKLQARSCDELRNLARARREN
ncbi:MAG TPA: hypothetical protein DIT13_07120 [Verrucomicrobiales bacterium]|nr:hypothetical protein [Verrucomicrobiales bacterium]